MALNRGHAYREQVDGDGRGQTVLAFLAARHPRATVDEWRGRIEHGEVTVDGTLAATSQPLRAGQIVTWQRPPWDEPEVPTTFDVLHEDEALVAVHKPRGLPTMPAGGFLEHTLLALVRARFPEASPMHRLGRDTSGLVLFARTAEARGKIQAAWRGHEVEKTYRALASGVAGPDELDLTAPIGPVPHALLGTVHAADAAGRASHSHATVLERREASTLFEVAITTGRPHQIRIHLAFAGHPLVGDPLYAPGGRPHPDSVALPGDLGYALHAARLAFIHPTTGLRLELRALPPEELRMAGEGG